MSTKPANKRKTERIIIGVSDSERRKNLLTNAECGLGKVQQVGENLLYTVGSEDYGFIEYFILKATVPITGKIENTR